MSCVTVNVPWAPQPLACMRRSGITSRSKCANFSISQISCSNAGPRRPAVMMLVLSATGAPVALVNRVVFDMVGSWGLDMVDSWMFEDFGRGRRQVLSDLCFRKPQRLRVRYEDEERYNRARRILR